MNGFGFKPINILHSKRLFHKQYGFFILVYNIIHFFLFVIFIIIGICRLYLHISYYGMLELLRPGDGTYFDVSSNIRSTDEL